MFPDVVFLGDGCGGDERNHTVLALRLMVVLQVLVMTWDVVSLR